MNQEESNSWRFDLYNLLPHPAEPLLWARRLALYDVPSTLGHGDLHGDNVARQGDDYLLIDWTDACVMHPFLDMIIISYVEKGKLQTHLRDQYLSHWRAFEKRARLREAWDIAQPLMCLHQAISYQVILDHIEPGARDDLAWGPPYWLRRILELYGTTNRAG